MHYIIRMTSLMHDICLKNRTETSKENVTEGLRAIIEVRHETI